MRIDKLYIKNFKGFENEEFNFNPHFTVLIGDNAKGKTSLLDALSVAVGSYFLGIDVASQRGIQKNEIRIRTIDDDPRPQLPVLIKADGILFNETLSWSRGVEKMAKNISTTTKDTKEIRGKAEEILKSSRIGEKVCFPVIAYYGTGRLWAEHEKISYKKGTEGVEMAYKNCLSLKSSSREFLSWYKTMEDEITKFENPKEIKLLNAFKKAITGMIPDKAWEDMNFSFKENDLIGTFKTPDGRKEKLRFKQLSDGYRNVIGMVADIAYRCIKLNPHLGEDVIKETTGIVLIDELDQNIHPKWQKTLVSDLKRTFPSIQFIATTHSPFIVQSLESDELYNLDRIVDGVPSEYNIGQISTHFMGVESNFSKENFEKYEDTKELLTLLNSENTNQDELDSLLTKISDPSIRAFLELNILSKNKK